MKYWIYAKVWMNLENIILTERSQTQRQLIIWLHLYSISRISTSMETGSRLVAPGMWEFGENDDWLVIGTGFSWGVDKNVLNLIVMTIGNHWIAQTFNWTLHMSEFYSTWFVSQWSCYKETQVKNVFIIHLMTIYLNSYIGVLNLECTLQSHRVHLKILKPSLPD